MRCEDARLILSSALDRQATPNEGDLADAHLAACTSCGEWMESVHRVNRVLRVQEVKVTDLTSQIMQEWDSVQGRPPVPFALRMALALTGTLTLLFSTPLVINGSTAFGEPVANHPARELGAFGLALAAAFLLSAWDGRARSRLIVVATGVAALMATGLADMISGNTTIVYELGHVPEVVGLLLMGLMSRHEPSPPRPLLRNRGHGIHKAA